MSKIWGTSLEEIQGKIRERKLTCHELVSYYLKEIDKTGDLNVYVEVYAEEALLAAKQTDLKVENGTALGDLFGLVISIKDVISHKGHGLTAGSQMLQGYKALYSATAVQRLLDEDCIIIGRVNCDEFAMGSANENSFYGPVRNAIDPSRVSGGSSGGSAVSVQANTCLMSLGSDTGGSVRQPASFCNLIGFKPSYGRISRHGLIAYASSFDQIGIIGHYLPDMAKVYMVMQGPDDYDGTLTSVAHDPKPHNDSVSRFGYIQEALDHEGLDPVIRRAFIDKIAMLRKKGHQVESVSLPWLDYIIPSYYVLTSAEASSNLSRYDGIRYGYRSEMAESLDDMYTMSRTEGFGTEVKRRILLGTFVLSVGYYDAYFAKAQKIRRLIKDQIDLWMGTYDALLLPMTPTSAWTIGQSKDPVEVYLADIFSVLANLIGAPGVSLPLGYDADQMPFGIQLIGKSFCENKLISTANYISNLS